MLPKFWNMQTIQGHTVSITIEILTCSYWGIKQVQLFKLESIGEKSH